MKNNIWSIPNQKAPRIFDFQGRIVFHCYKLTDLRMIKDAIKINSSPVELQIGKVHFTNQFDLILEKENDINKRNNSWEIILARVQG